MGFSNFRFVVLLRVILLVLTVSALVYLVFITEKYFSASLVGVLLVFEVISLCLYVENTNRKLTRFLEHIKYSDFTSGFNSDNQIGKSFRELNKAFNEVLEAFREARSEKEEHLQYLNTVVQHVETGLVAFNQKGEIQLMNTAANRLLKVAHLRQISDLNTLYPSLNKVLSELNPGETTLFRNSNNEELALNATEIIMKGKPYKLISFHNIQAELQKKELEAWQNLTKVLRHEIMNSIAPISSLTSTLKDILEDEFTNLEPGEPISQETIEDVQEALSTIENRSHALARFVNAYKDFTQIPAPHFQLVLMEEVIQNINSLMQAEFKNREIELNWKITTPSLKITIDPEMIEMVLINLVKNALQSVENTKGGKVEIIGGLNSNIRPFIVVRDNGPGIIPEALERIFIPFFTTKKDGSGIGLALSRQILHKHKGSLSVSSKQDELTEFILTL